MHTVAFKLTVPRLITDKHFNFNDSLFSTKLEAI